MNTDPTFSAAEAQAAGALPGDGDGPSEAELRASYEAELSRITSTDLMLQAAVSLLNIAAHRLGAPTGPDGGLSGEPSAPQRDMEQVRDGIDAVRALLEILERRIPTEVRPLRDALSRLQLAYAREAQGAGGNAEPAAPPSAGPASPAPSGATSPEPGVETAPGAPGQAPADPTGTDEKEQPGPAQASGRLWVPGR
jgi:hypothetical protein